MSAREKKPVEWQVGRPQGLGRDYRVTIFPDGNRLVEISIAETYSAKSKSGARGFHYRVVRQYTRTGEKSRAWAEAVQAAESRAALSRSAT